MGRKLIKDQENLESLLQDAVSDWVYENRIENATITVEITVEDGWNRAIVVKAQS